MAHRERYERTYEGDVVGVVLKTGNTTDFELIGRDGGPHVPGVATVTDVQRHVDQLVGSRPQGDWRWVAECFVCLHRPATIEGVHARDMSRVSCPNCGDYTISGITANGCQQFHDSADGRARMSNVARFMATKNPQHRHLNTDSFDYFEQEGRNLARG